LVVFKPGAMHPHTTSTIKALACFYFPGLRLEIQATRYLGWPLTEKPLPPIF
jgi:hypothetical protein